MIELYKELSTEDTYQEDTAVARIETLISAHAGSIHKLHREKGDIIEAALTHILETINTSSRTSERTVEKQRTYVGWQSGSGRQVRWLPYL